MYIYYDIGVTKCLLRRFVTKCVSYDFGGNRLFQQLAGIGDLALQLTV